MKLISIFLVLICSFQAIAADEVNGTDILHLNWRDTSINPSDNFYLYSIGNWQKQNPIPPQYSSWGTFSILHENMQKLIHEMLVNAANNKSAKPGSIEQKIGDFYYSGMNEEVIEKLGALPLKEDFDRINSIKSIKDLQAVMTYLQQIGVSVCFSFGSMQDFADSNKMIASINQDGLSLPDRDYYLKSDVKFKEIRSAYLEHLKKMFELLGDDSARAKNNARVVMNIETLLAKASMSQIDQRDPHATYHLMDVDKLNKITSNFSWSKYLKSIGYPNIKEINLAEPDFFKKMNEMLSKISLEDWKIYLRWHLLDSYAAYLSKPFVNQNFKMISVLTGTKEILPRWQRVVRTENQALGFAIGKIYVEKYFPEESKVQVLEILHNIKEQLRADLKTIKWMSTKTREAALKKLDLMGERVGYPNKWWDYSSLKIDRDSYITNIKRTNEFLNKRDLDKIGKPIDKSEWAMTPQTINAYYDPSMNNINIPAGILQPPFFDPKAPAAINYGAIGFVMGHEMTHGFDDQGSQFDGYGNLKNWWTKRDLEKFHEATNCIIKQFSNYKVNGNFRVQGKLVVGEATADLGGLTLSYHAFHDSKAYKDAKVIDGFTPLQQFFLSVGHVWASNIRSEEERNLVTVDPHPPARYRVNGTLANMPAFKNAFSLTSNSMMINKEICIIW